MHECLLRLSVPRWLGSIKEPLIYSILKEIFLAGSLTKVEIARQVIEANRKVKSYTENEVLKTIDELTLSHHLIGVSSHTLNR
jgi:hypothetical protein